MDDVLAPDGPTGDFAVPLRGARTQAVVLGLLAVLVLGLVELAIGETHHLAGWWWAPVLMVLPVVLLVARTLRGVLVAAEGDQLVVRRLLGTQRIPASTISAIQLAGVVDERVEVVRATGRTWSFAAPDSPEADRHRAVAAALAWLDAHGGPVPVQDGPLRDGERLGFGADATSWTQVVMLASVEVVAVVICVRNLVRATSMSPRVWATVALLLLSLGVLALLVWRLVGSRTTVQGDCIVVRRALLPPRRIHAADVEGMQVTMSNNEPGVRVLVTGRWVVLPLHMRPLDHPRAVLRLAAWLQVHGARLSVHDEAPRRGDRALMDLLVPVVVSFVGITWLLGAYSHGLGGIWVAVGSMTAGIASRPRALDPSRIDDTRGLAWSFQR